MIGALTERLRETQNGDGGWGAVRGRQSNTEATALATLEFSWVEPTAYALIALKKLRPVQGDGRSDRSIAEAERMLYDRACAEGGWNYGNSTAYGVELPPYLETTALALLALQDRRDDERN